MTAVIILAAGIAAALAACRFIWHEAPTTGDLAIGFISGMVGLTFARLFSGGGWSFALPLLVACACALALSALRQSPAESDPGPSIHDGQTRRLDQWLRRG